MTIEDRLKERLFNKLSEYSQIEAFFNDKLLRRAKQPNWMENDLVLLALQDRDENLHLIEGMLKAVSDYDIDLLEDLKSGLRGAEKQFDHQLRDLFAELNAANHLIRDGYSNLRKIPRQETRTPDFEAHLGNKRYLFEVKNLRAPEEIPNQIANQFDVARLTQRIAINHFVFLKYTIPDILVGDTLLSRGDISRLLDQIAEQCQNGIEFQSYYMNATSGIKGYRVKVECSIEGDKGYHLMWRVIYARGGGKKTGTGFTRSALGRKVRRVACVGLKQLLDYDAGNGLHKSVLLNLNRSSPWVYPPSLEQDLVIWVGKLSRRFNRLRPDISFRLLR